MREVKSESFEKLEAAIKECASSSTSLDGLALACPTLEPHKIQMAAVQALSFIFEDFVRPDNLKFIAGFGAEQNEW